MTSAATPRLAMRAHKMSPKMPASVTPMASTTATQPSGIASIAARVEIGAPHEAGVDKSSRAGTNRSVKARPTTRPWPGRSGLVPRIQTLRRPFFRRTVVIVAVETSLRTSRDASRGVSGFMASSVSGPAVSGPAVPGCVIATCDRRRTRHRHRCGMFHSPAPIVQSGDAIDLNAGAAHSTTMASNRPPIAHRLPRPPCDGPGFVRLPQRRAPARKR